MKTLKVYRSMGSTFGVGWMMDAAPIMHVFANVEPGEKFQPSNGHDGPHWPCKVCDDHGYTEQDFHSQIEAALERGPV